MNNIIGLDIGGTKITGAVFDGKKAVRQLTVPTPQNARALTVLLKGLVGSLNTNKSIKQIGIGVAGNVNPEALVINWSPNLKYLKNFSFKGVFAKPYEVKLENDANCFALAESCLGQGKGLQNFIGITLGTGIGSGLVSKGQLYRGVHGGAGEIGHAPASHKETYEELFQKARDEKDFRKVGEILGDMFAMVMRVVDVEALILGGGVASSHSRQFLPVAVRVMKSKLKSPGLYPVVKVSRLNFAGALGAALLFK